MAKCYKYSITNTATTWVTFGYHNCDSNTIVTQNELFPGQTKYVWAYEDTINSAFNKGYDENNETLNPPILNQPPACSDRVFVMQICNSNSFHDDNFDIYLNGSNIGSVDLNQDDLVGSLFIGSITPVTFDTLDATCPIENMVIYYFNPAIIQANNTINMINIQDNDGGNEGTIEIRNYLNSGGTLLNSCYIADLIYEGPSGENFTGLTFTYDACCNGLSGGTPLLSSHYQNTTVSTTQAPVTTTTTQPIITTTTTQTPVTTTTTLALITTTTTQPIITTTTTLAPVTTTTTLSPITTTTTQTPVTTTTTTLSPITTTTTTLSQITTTTTQAPVTTTTTQPVITTTTTLTPITTTTTQTPVTTTTTTQAPVTTTTTLAPITTTTTQTPVTTTTTTLAPITTTTTQTPVTTTTTQAPVTTTTTQTPVTTTTTIL